MAASAILDFKICDILLADGVWRVQTHNFTKFRQNRSFHCANIAIFRIFKMAAAAILDFWQLKILLPIGWRGLRRINVPTFVKIGQSVVKILRFFDFSRWRPPPSLIFKFVKFYWLTVSGGPRRITTKFRQNRSFRCFDIAIFRIFKMAAAAILDFWNLKILLVIRIQRIRHIGFVSGIFGPPTVSRPTCGSLSLC